MLLPFFQDKITEAGVDEAGRGCFAGPVFAASVILSKDFFHPQLNDSKQLTADQRYLLRPFIEQHALAWAVASVSNEEIDRINILQASFEAMHVAIGKLTLKPELLLIDGNRFRPYRDIPHQCFIKGDGRYASIAAASILAKTYRDDSMIKLDEKYSMYGWKRNKGYGTMEHRKAIKEFGICEYHRRSFHLIS